MVVGAVADGDAEAFEEDAEQIAGRAGPAEQNVVGGGGVNLDSRQGRQGGGEIRTAFGVLGAGLCRKVRGIREDGLRGGQRKGVDAPRRQLVPDGLRQLRIGGEISEAHARNGMEFGQRAQGNAVFRKPLQHGSLRFRPGVFDKRFINDPKEIGA